jgi:hypothetical protein
VPNYVPERLVAERPPALWKHGRPLIGWAGSGSHRQDFEQVVTPLRMLLRHRMADVRIVGPDYTPRLRTAVRPGSLDERLVLTHAEWVDGVDAYMQSLHFQVGLAPLLDDPFNRSKSDIKIKEYAARGIVAIASPVGPYAPDIAPRLTATDDWTEKLMVLISNDTHRTHLAEIGLEWARANTIEAHAIEWERALLP